MYTGKYYIIGGGKRCSISGCDNIVRSKGLCIGHGGGKRCNVAECPNSAVGSTGVCKAHGAGKIIKENKPEQLPHVAIPPKNLPIMERLRIINAQRALEHERESICKERGCQMLVVEKSKYCESHSRQRGDKERGAKRRRTSVSSSEQVNGKDDHSRQSSTKQCKVKGCNGFALNKNLLCKIHTRSRSCRIKSCPRRSMRFGDFCSDHCGFKSTCPPNSGVQIHPNPSTDTPTTPSQAQEACRVTPYENNNGVHQKNFYDITHSTKSDTESFLKSAARNLVAMHQTQIL
uniref:WRKY19-like zinc finger domain-containing protein n=1 Tax=Aplanochytrium stocchinoi TaxID=215587 RepID=A0A7S3LIC5_9STRA